MKTHSSILLIVFTLIITVVNCQKEKCYTVEKGSHYSKLLPFNGFTNNDKQFSLIKFSTNSANYLFDFNDHKGQLCMTSWNKLFGVSRCGYLNHQHTDSDRFVWRRAQSCLNMSNGFVVSEKLDCDEMGLIEIAAYAYDNKSKPYSAENQGRLLKVFQTKIKTDQWYGFALQILPTETIYELRNESGFSIEALKVDHRDCGSSYKSGSKQGFYFGGQCPAPQAVTACFKEY